MLSTAVVADALRVKTNLLYSSECWNCISDLSWHRVRDNDEIQALLDTGNDYR